MLNSTTEKQKVPPSTQTKEKFVARQLDDSFADLHTGATRQTSSDLKESVDIDGSPTSLFLMSEMRKLSEEVRIRDEHHKGSEIRRDADIRQLISGYQQKGEDMRKLITECQKKRLYNETER